MKSWMVFFAALLISSGGSNNNHEVVSAFFVPMNQPHRLISWKGANAKAATTVTTTTFSLPHQPSRLILEAKLTKGKRSSSSSSTGSSSSNVNSLQPLLKFAFPDKPSSPMESGVETALLLLDKKRQVEFKKDMLRQFPFIPEFVMDVCVDSLADSFEAVAPAKLKMALKPGGLEKVRPEIEETISNSLQDQKMIQDLPLTKADKAKLVKYMVRSSLDYLLRDVNEILKEPTERLQTLEQQKYQIKRYMTFWQLTLYRIQYYPVQMGLVGVGTILSTLFLVQQYQKTALAAFVSKTIATIFAAISSYCLSIFTAVQTPLKTCSILIGNVKASYIDQLTVMGVIKTVKTQAKKFRR